MIWIDFTLIGIVFVCVLIGLLRGFIREVFSLGFWILASGVSLRFSGEFLRIASLQIGTYPPLAAVGGYLESNFNQPSARMAASFLALFSITLGFGGLIGFLMGASVKNAGLTFMDRFGGMVVGVVRGMAVVTVVIILAGLTSLPKDSWWIQSTVIPPFQALAIWLRDHSSSGLTDCISYR